MKIIDDDFTFTTNDWGTTQQKYGTGAECRNPTGANMGRIRMNLHGTDFKFHPMVSNQLN